MPSDHPFPSRRRVPSRPLPPTPSLTLSVPTLSFIASSSPSSNSPLILTPASAEGLWYRKMSLWPPAEFADPFASAPPHALKRKQTSAPDDTHSATDHNDSTSPPNISSVQDTTTTTIVFDEVTVVNGNVDKDAPNDPSLKAGDPSPPRRPNYVLRRTATNPSDITSSTTNSSSAASSSQSIHSKSSSIDKSLPDPPRKLTKRGPSLKIFSRNPTTKGHKASSSEPTISHITHSPVSTAFEKVQVLAVSSAPKTEMTSNGMGNSTAKETGILELPTYVPSSDFSTALSLTGLKAITETPSATPTPSSSSPPSPSMMLFKLPLFASASSPNPRKRKPSLRVESNNAVPESLLVPKSSASPPMETAALSADAPSLKVTVSSGTHSAVLDVPPRMPTPIPPTVPRKKTKRPQTAPSPRLSPTSSLPPSPSKQPPSSFVYRFPPSPTTPTPLPDRTISTSVPQRFPAVSQSSVSSSWHVQERDREPRRIRRPTTASSAATSVVPDSIFSRYPASSIGTSVTRPSTAATSHYQPSLYKSGYLSSTFDAGHGHGARSMVNVNDGLKSVFNGSTEEVENQGGTWEEHVDPWGIVAEAQRARESAQARKDFLAGSDGMTSKSRNKSKKSKALKTIEEDVFDENEPLSTADVFKASLLDVLDVDGNPVRFGTLFEDKLTIFCFIRHFWCPLCQDYVQSIMENAPKEALDRSGVQLIIIGHGSPSMAKAYRDNVFQCPYSIYVDPTRMLYRALGMTRRTNDAGAEEDKGDYVTHGSVGGIGMVMKNALKMPIGRAGDIKQLGGEFLLGPGIRADYAHRMPTTRSHTSVRKLLQLANVDLSPIPPKLRLFLDVEVEDAWMKARTQELEGMLLFKELRKLGVDSGYDYSFADRPEGDDLCGDGLCSVPVAPAPTPTGFGAWSSSIPIGLDLDFRRPRGSTETV